MKKISKNAYLACQYAMEHPEISIQKIASTFNVDRHTITVHLQDYINYNFLYQDEYYYITNEEQEPILYYLQNPNCTFKELNQKYHIKADTVKRRLAVMGYSTERRYKKQYNRNAFDSITTEEDAYWLGFILADGYLNEDRNFLKIKLGIQDENHLKKFASYMQDTDCKLIYEYGGATTRDNLCVGIEYDSQSIVKNLKKWGIFQNKSGKEKPIYFSDFNLQKAYVRGMIDGDGHIENGYFKYVGSLDSCLYMKSFFNHYYNFNDDAKYIYPHGSIYSFELRNHNAVNVALTDIYQDATIYLDRKYKIVKNYCRV